MEKVTPPNPVTRALLEISRVSESDFGKIVDSLSATPLPSSPRLARELVCRAVPEMPEKAIGTILGFATAFSAALPRVDDRDGFVESIVERAKADVDEEWNSDIHTRIKLLLESPAVSFLGVGESALRDSPHVVQEMSVETNLRPLVLPNTGVGKHFAILHRLKLDYSTGWGDKTVRSIELVFEQRDLVALADKIEEVLEAQLSIQDVLVEGGGVVFMPYEKEEGEGGEI